MIRDLLSLISPSLCAACSAPLNKGEQDICVSCLFALPETNYHLRPDNPVARIFWGRVEVNKATAFYSLGKESKVQKLIHRFKYKGKKEIGLFLGRQFASRLQQTRWASEMDMIVPVPLHPCKLIKRGYNQSAYFARGLSEVLSIPVVEESLVRTRNNSSQTHNSRYRRWKNAEFLFSVTHPEQIRSKHILLVDDIVTSGSTLETCAREILKTPGTSVSIAVMAHTDLKKN